MITALRSCLGHELCALALASSTADRLPNRSIKRWAMGLVSPLVITWNNSSSKT